MIKLPLSIKETQDGLINNDYSVVELVSKYFSQIKKYNDEYNIYLTLAEEEAIKKAKNQDKLLSELGKNVLKDKPLLGVTVALKDIYMTKNLRTTAASKVLESYIPKYSATVVKKLEIAGTITLGKVNCDAWAHGSSGENSDFGATKNPWKKDYVPGGSSSGSGAALSANMSLTSAGTDTCGSTRLPANYNLTVGLKPTYGVISRFGVIAMASSLDTVGPMGRTIEDIETVFDTVKGEDGYDGTVKDFDKPKYLKEKFVIGVPKEFFGEGLDGEVKKNVQEAIETFKKLGVEIVELSLPTTKYGISVYYIVQPAEVSSNLGRFDGIRYGNSRESFGEEAKRRIVLGSYVLSSGYYDAYYQKASLVRTKIINEVNKVFEKVDALITPVAPTPPFKIGDKTSDPLTMYLTDIFAATANLCGIPSLAIPTKLNSNGLPLGFQLMGPRFSEYTLFELGKRFHKEIGYKPKVAL